MYCQRAPAGNARVWGQACIDHVLPTHTHTRIANAYTCAPAGNARSLGGPVIAPRASLIEFPGSRNRVTYGGYGQFSCVREREHPCVLTCTSYSCPSLCCLGASQCPGSYTHGVCHQRQLLHSPSAQDRLGQPMRATAQLSVCW